MHSNCGNLRETPDYVEGLSRIEEKDDILGGSAVFKGTRLSVDHVGKMLEKGTPEREILEDYAYLTKTDLDFSRLYFLAHRRKEAVFANRIREPEGDELEWASQRAKELGLP